jgi:hypothetical protein
MVGTFTTGALTSASARCAETWCTARSVGSTPSASPTPSTLIRLAQLLDEPVLKDVLARLVALGRERRVVHGRRLRVDTAVVETNIHYPTDATLLADGVRVLTRTLSGGRSGRSHPSTSRDTPWRERELPRRGCL